MVHLIRVEYVNFVYKTYILHVTVVNKSTCCTSQIKLSALLSNVHYQEINV